MAYTISLRKILGLDESKAAFNFKNELFAGLTVAMTMIPESLSFAILAGLNPLTGLYAAFLMGLVTSVLGGRPGMVSGGAGATIVVLMALIAQYGVEYLFATVALGGLMQVAVGVLRFGKFVRLIPQPVMYGFLNGLAIIIFMAQVSQFKLVENGVSKWMQGSPLWIMVGLTGLTMVMVWFIPRLTRRIPSSLIAIMVLFALVHLLGIDTKKVLDIASVSGSFPPFHIPQVPLTWETLQIIFPYALVMAGVGLIESLLTLNMVDEITGTRGKANKESIAQGFANITNGFFSGMGGCAMVAQTLVNISAGARTRLAALIGALTILLVILVAGPLIEQIPMAALVGVMMMVAISTFEWASLRVVRKMPRQDVFIGFLVAAITVLMHNLALAVLIGVILSALVFAWESAKRIRARKYMDEEGVKVYELYGPLFFGSISNFMEKFDPDEDPERVVLDFKESRVMDMSAIEALNKLTSRYHARGKTLHLKHLSPDCRRLLQDAKGVIEVNILEDPTYRVMIP